MESNNGFFSGISNFFSNIFFAGILFAVLVYFNIKLGVHYFSENQELNKLNEKIAQLTTEKETLAARVASIDNKNKSLAYVNEQNSIIISELKTENSSLVSSYETEKGNHAKTVKANARWKKKTEQLNQKVAAEKIRIQELNEEQNLLQAKNDTLSNLNGILKAKNTTLGQDIDKVILAKNSLSDTVEVLKVINADNGQHIAYLESREVLVNEGIRANKVKVARGISGNLVLFLVGLLLGRFLYDPSFYKKSQLPNP